MLNNVKNERFIWISRFFVLFLQYQNKQIINN